MKALLTRLTITGSPALLARFVLDRHSRSFRGGSDEVGLVPSWRMWKIGAPLALNAFSSSAMRATASGLLRRLPAASHSSNARWTSTTMRAGREWGMEG